mmetsp:Transcript_13928/g.39797  ORF Transcript_13928/g.39797 Transcript_13928/m.39797 type:complete len:237 (+) Transcript_13928:226-936(+)
MCDESRSLLKRCVSRCSAAIGRRPCRSSAASVLRSMPSPLCGLCCWRRRPRSSPSRARHMQWHACRPSSPSRPLTPPPATASIACASNSLRRSGRTTARQEPLARSRSLSPAAASRGGPCGRSWSDTCPPSMLFPREGCPCFCGRLSVTSSCTACTTKTRASMATGSDRPRPSCKTATAGRRPCRCAASPDCPRTWTRSGSWPLRAMAGTSCPLRETAQRRSGSVPNRMASMSPTS